MSLATLDDLRLVAPGPETVTGGQAQAFGAAGMNDFYYWVVARYPIGVSISGPFHVRDAPNVLDATNYVLIVWNAAIGAQSYDVLRTRTANFPRMPGNFAVAAGIVNTSTTDRGQTLGFYTAPPAAPAPALCRIHLNNRDYQQPTLQFPCYIAVTNIIFADGSQQSTAAGAGGAAGATTNIQFNNAGAFDASPNLTFDKTNSLLKSNATVMVTGADPNLAAAGVAGVEISYPAGGPGLIQAYDYGAGSSQRLELQGNWIELSNPDTAAFFSLGSGGGSQLSSPNGPIVLTSGNIGFGKTFNLNTGGWNVGTNTATIMQVNDVSANNATTGMRIQALNNNLGTDAHIDITTDGYIVIDGYYLTTLASNVLAQNGLDIGPNTTGSYFHIGQWDFGWKGGSSYVIEISALNGTDFAVITTGSGFYPSIRVNGSDGFVGIHTAGPAAYQLDVNGNMNVAAGYNYYIGGVALSGQPQTPWAQNINAATFQLNNCGVIGIGTTSNTNYGVYVTYPAGIGFMVSNNSTSTGFQHSQSSPTLSGQMILQNNIGNGINIAAVGGSASSFPNTAWIRLNTVPLVFTSQLTEIMRLTTAGNLGIGVNPTHQLQLSTDDAAKTTTTTWTTTSDARLKQKVKPLKGGLDIIGQIHPVEAEYNGLHGTPKGHRVVSFVVEDLKKVLPGCVPTHRGKLRDDDDEETEIHDFNPHEILFHLILGVQQLASKLGEMEAAAADAGEKANHKKGKAHR